LGKDCKASGLSPDSGDDGYGERPEEKFYRILGSGQSEKNINNLSGSAHWLENV